jgi:hypothetical protein
VDNLPKYWAWKAELVAEFDAGILMTFARAGLQKLHDIESAGTSRVTNDLMATVRAGSYSNSVRTTKAQFRPSYRPS